MNNNNLNYKVYWEKQGVDSLCGVHCINSLLQGTHTITGRPLLRRDLPVQHRPGVGQEGARAHGRAGHDQ